MDRNDIAKRMKDYEHRNQHYLQRRTPVAIRVDGRSFHTFTRGFERPFDEILIKSMQDTMKYMCENTGNAVFGYCQSDEITIILIDYKELDSDCWFGYRTDKLCSVAASMATMAFNKYFAKRVENFIQNCAIEYETEGLHGKGTKMYNMCEIYQKAIEKGAMFDARCFNIPKEEVTNLIYWRQLDASRNSIQMVGQANFSHKELQHKSCSDIQDMLMEQKGINWNDFPTVQKRGSACIKETTIKEIVIPQPFGDPREKIVCTSSWKIDTEMPILKGADRVYVDDLIYVGE